jgi:hypothetical protein
LRAVHRLVAAGMGVTTIDCDEERHSINARIQP